MEWNNNRRVDMWGKKGIAALFFLMGSFSLWAFTFVPELERANASFGDTRVFKDLHQMAMDDSGRLCIAALRSGLVCYDGPSLTVVHDVAAGLLAVDDTDGKRTLFFSDGYNVYTLSNGRVRLQIPRNLFNFAQREVIKHLLPPGDSGRWGIHFLVVSSHAVYRYDNGQITKLTTEQDAVPLHASMHNGAVRIGTHKGLVLVDEYGVRETRFDGFKVNHLVDNLVLTNRGVYDIDSQTPIAKGNFITAARTRTGTVLLAGYPGLCAYEPGPDHGQVYCPRQSDDVVYSMVVDKFNTVWAVTNNGLKYARLSAIQRLDNRYGLSSNTVLDLAMRDDTVFMATPRGVNTFNMQTGVVGLLDFTANLGVRALLVDTVSDSLWIATIGSGLYRYDFALDSFHVVDAEYQGRMVDLVHFNEQIWVATQYDGFNLYHRSGKLLRSGMHKGIKKIRKMEVCNSSLYFSSHKHGLVRLEKNADVLALSDGQVLNGVFACTRSTGRGSTGASIVSARPDRLVEHDTDLQPKQDWPDLAPGTDITALFDYDQGLWQLDARGLKRLDDGRYFENGESLEYIYNNAVLINDGHYLLAGSSRGAVIIHLPSLVKGQYRPVALSASITPAPGDLSGPGHTGTSGASVNDPGSLLVSLFTDDLLALAHYQLHFRYDAESGYRPLGRGSLLLERMPDSGRVWFRARGPYGKQMELDIDLEPYRAVFVRGNKSNIATDYPLIALVSAGLLLLVCTMLYGVHYGFYRHPMERANRMPSLPLASADARPEAELGVMGQSDASPEGEPVATRQPADDQPGLSSLSSVASEAELRQALAGYGSSGGKLIACMDVLQRQPGLKFAKTLAYEAGISNDALRDSVQKLFGFKSSKEFIAFYRRLQRS